MFNISAYRFIGLKYVFIIICWLWKQYSRIQICQINQHEHFLITNYFMKENKMPANLELMLFIIVITQFKVKLYDISRELFFYQ